MRAAVSTEYGPPEIVRIRDVERPTPADDELLIKVHATTVNRTDCGYRGGKPFLIRFFNGWRRPKVPILGTEFAGVVEAAGTGVSSFRVGDRICGWCEGTFGAHAEYLTIRAGRPLNCMIPEGVAFEEAAPSTEGSHYALSFLRQAGVEAGQDVMVYGATGAIGSAAVQLAKGLGLRVTAVCGTEHVDLVTGLGADRVIDYMTEDYTSDTGRYDLVIDAVGKSSLWKCRRLLKPKGIYTASDRPWAQKPGLFIPVFLGWLLVSGVTRLLRGRRQMFVVPRSDPEGLRWLKDQIESGTFRPVIDRSYPLEQIVEAYRYVETGEKIGNVVIKV
jgi:NADPH:quinone reductase-like Zn-dependent oxidoreductase